MKTVFVVASPKKRLSASDYVAALQRLFVKGEKVTLPLRNKRDYQPILDALTDADNVVFSLPLYEDGIPAHVLPFLQQLEAYAKEKGLKPNLYTLANNGFIEGRQNEGLMQQFENFCDRAGFTWGGGVGIGGGVMLNVTRFLVLLQVVLLVLNLIISVIMDGVLFPKEPLVSFAINVGAALFFNLGVLYFLGRLGDAINRRGKEGKRYTRILVPTFLFILFADIFFFLTSIFEGGLFRGWLAKKEEPR